MTYEYVLESDPKTCQYLRDKGWTIVIYDGLPYWSNSKIYGARGLWTNEAARMQYRIDKKRAESFKACNLHIGSEKTS